jgi:aspartate carbamoyltransferase
MNSFLNRSLCVSKDFSIEEKRYLFEKAKELKKALNNEEKEILEEFRINDPDYGIYEVFLEDSTRTKESFRNAAKFHRSKISIFDAASSSFNKKESYADAFRMLIGYENKAFIIRSKLEGVCRWLRINAEEYAKKRGLKNPACFINAGDGKHEHPTQELLDEFSFLEDNNYDYKNLHVALIGDLFHGRTVHSKAEGLKVFDKVTVDLVAPKEISMPKQYIKKMEKNGFEVRIFDSIDSYLQDQRVAEKWYFTRPQLERMGENILKKEKELREKITVREDHLEKINENVKFYHPLPRHKERPTIPFFLDSTKHNRWEEQSRNGMIVRIILLGLVSGKLGNDYQGKIEEKKEDNELTKTILQKATIEMKKEINLRRRT